MAREAGAARARAGFSSRLHGRFIARSSALSLRERAFHQGRSTGRPVKAKKPREAASYTVEALSKGLRILALFSERRSSLRLTDIVGLTGLPMPTAFRLVATLEAEGYLERLPDGAVRPSAAVLTLGFAALRGLDLVQTSSVILSRLFAQTQQTVNLGVLAQDRVVYVSRLQSEAVLVTANVTVGSTLPAIVTSMGKVLLADLSDEDLRKRISASSFAGPWGPNAVRSITALKKELARVRTAGFAVQDEELAAGLRSIAAPVRAADGRVVAAVNVAVPARECSVEDLLARVREPLLSACAQISRRLGNP
jgi:IclR family pca regulon transcriptional regulator